MTYVCKYVRLCISSGRGNTCLHAWPLINHQDTSPCEGLVQSAGAQSYGLGLENQPPKQLASLLFLWCLRLCLRWNHRGRNSTPMALLTAQLGLLCISVHFREWQLQGLSMVCSLIFRARPEASFSFSISALILVPCVHLALKHALAQLFLFLGGDFSFLTCSKTNMKFYVSHGIKSC